jgi:hypothetical protein
MPRTVRVHRKRQHSVQYRGIRSRPVARQRPHTARHAMRRVAPDATCPKTSARDDKTEQTAWYAGHRVRARHSSAARMSLTSRAPPSLHTRARSFNRTGAARLNSPALFSDCSSTRSDPHFRSGLAGGEREPSLSRDPPGSRLLRRSRTGAVPRDRGFRFRNRWEYPGAGGGWRVGCFLSHGVGPALAASSAPANFCAGNGSPQQPQRFTHRQPLVHQPWTSGQTRQPQNRRGELSERQGAGERIQHATARRREVSVEERVRGGDG